MYKQFDSRAARQRRHRRIRVRLRGTEQRPRLSVFRSLNHIYAQLVDDAGGVTLVAASTLEPDLRAGAASQKKSDAARVVGRSLGERARARGINAAVFDRGGYLYHGRVKALADGAREAGLEF
jgi:large subunit ribosomal protein L18